MAMILAPLQVSSLIFSTGGLISLMVLCRTSPPPPLFHPAALPSCLPAFLPSCLPACPPSCLPSCSDLGCGSDVHRLIAYICVRGISGCVCACMSVCVRACVHASVRACVHVCVRACVHGCGRVEQAVPADCEVDAVASRLPHLIVDRRRGPLGTTPTRRSDADGRCCSEWQRRLPCWA